MRAARIVMKGCGVALLVASLLAGCGGSGNGSLIIVLTPSTNQSVDQNQSVALTAFVANDTSNSGVSWSLSGPHCTGAACGTLSNSTSASVTYVAPKSVGVLLSVTLTVTALANPKITTTLNITVSPSPVISTTSLPGAINGQNYSQQVVANGGVAPLVFSISSGTLPAGFHLNTNGLISGRATVDGGSFPFTLLVTDQGNPPLTASQSYTITISPAPPLSILTTSLANASQGSPYNFPLAASGGVPPLTWSITAGSLPPGLVLNATTGQISGTPTTQGPFPFTVEVTDSALLPPNQHSQTATQSLTLTVSVPKPLSITTTSLPQADTATLYSQQLLVGGGVGPFTWAMTSGILPSGLTLHPTTGVISGVPTAVSTNSFTVQVTDSESPAVQASASLTIVVVGSANNDALLNGNYIFVFNGFNSSGPVVLGGIFNANGTGSIFGSEDSNNVNPTGSTQNNGPGPTQNNTIAGIYSIGSDGRGSFSLSTGSIVYTYQFVFDSNGDAQFIEADDSGTHGTGILRRQTVSNFTPQSFSGNYAFGFAGTDSAGKRDAFAGVFHADGASLFENGNADTNDAGTLGTNLSGVTGTFLLGQNGRGTATITLPSATLTFVFYMISPSDALFVGVDPLSQTNPMTTGEALLQTQPSFAPAALNASSVVTATGLGASGNSSVLAGLLSANGANGITATLDANAGGTITSAPLATGSYSVAANGRVTTSGIGNQLAVLYLVAPNQAFLIGQDPAASSGIVEAQSGGPSFSAASLISYFSFGPPLSGSPAVSDKSSNDFVGSLLADGVANLSGKLDEAAPTGIPSSNLALKATYTVAANGRGAMSVSTPSVLPAQIVFYVVSPAEIRAISAASADTHPQVFFLNH